MRGVRARRKGREKSKRFNRRRNDSALFASRGAHGAHYENERSKILNLPLSDHFFDVAEYFRFSAGRRKWEMLFVIRTSRGEVLYSPPAHSPRDKNESAGDEYKFSADTRHEVSKIFVYRYSIHGTLDISSRKYSRAPRARRERGVSNDGEFPGDPTPLTHGDAPRHNRKRSRGNIIMRERRFRGGKSILAINIVNVIATPAADVTRDTKRWRSWKRDCAIELPVRSIRRWLIIDNRRGDSQSLAGMFFILAINHRRSSSSPLPVTER